jgi:hypothetical protein
VRFAGLIPDGIDHRRGEVAGGTVNPSLTLKYIIPFKYNWLR